MRFKDIKTKKENRILVSGLFTGMIFTVFAAMMVDFSFAIIENANFITRSLVAMFTMIIIYYIIIKNIDKLFNYIYKNNDFSQSVSKINKVK